jgi:hypothetical protein
MDNQDNQNSQPTNNQYAPSPTPPITHPESQVEPPQQQEPEAPQEQQQSVFDSEITLPAVYRAHALGSKKDGVLHIQGQFVNMLDKQQQPLFSLNMSDIKNVNLSPGKIVMKKKGMGTTYKILFDKDFNLPEEIETLSEKFAGRPAAIHSSGEFNNIQNNNFVAGNDQVTQAAEVHRKRGALLALKNIFEQNGVVVKGKVSNVWQG